jgi:hypothetical protein
VPYVSISRWKKRGLAQPENNLRVSFIYDVQTEKRGVRSSRTLYNLNLKKRICGQRRENEEDF